MVLVIVCYFLVIGCCIVILLLSDIFKFEKLSLVKFGVFSKLLNKVFIFVIVVNLCCVNFFIKFGILCGFVISIFKLLYFINVR